jgi:serine/threonine protein kinase
MNTTDMDLYIDALEGINFLHSHGYIHGDVKPQNIGINSKAAVILDMGGAAEFSSGDYITSSPGTRGSIGYLAPEYEMGRYNQAVDMWSMGVILFMLIEGHHPWAFSQNPWRPGNERLRPAFHIKYIESTNEIYNGSTLKLLKSRSTVIHALFKTSQNK